jgi:hypothetical protein
MPMNPHDVKIEATGAWRGHDAWLLGLRIKGRHRIVSIPDTMLPVVDEIIEHWLTSEGLFPFALDLPPSSKDRDSCTRRAELRTRKLMT